MSLTIADQMKSAGKTALNGFQQLFSEARHRFDGVSAAWVIADDATEASAVQLLEHKRLLARLLGSLTGLMLSLGITYYGVRWLVNAMDPTRREKLEAQERAQKLMKTIGINKAKLTEYELCVASNLVDPLSMDTDWEDIGGLSETIQEIQETIILPFRHHELFAGSELVQPPKGVLLYGPPGCGKTLIARATAKAAGARFINLQVSTLVDKWYGESQKRAEAVFSLAHKLQPTIIFIDEIDSFLRSRASNDHEATSMMKTQFMSFWDGLTSDSRTRIMIIGATNRPNDVDAAILRRMSTRFHIGLPSTRQRRQILDIILRSEMLHSSVNLDDLASNTDGMSGSDLHELCRSAAICRVRELLNNTDSSSSSSDTQRANIPSEAQARNLRPIKAADFERALNKMKLGNRSMSQLSAYTLD